MNVPAPAPASQPPRGAAFAGILGLVLALGLLKFGNPIILDALVDTPRTLEEWRVFAWPVRFGYPLLAVAVALALPLALRPRRLGLPTATTACLAAWLGWQILATVLQADRAVALPILVHFAALTACFLLGGQALARCEELRTFWICLAGAFLVVLAMAADQRFGGLETTRKMILESAQGQNLPPEYLARIRSNRVFSTLVYPNALAGAVLLLLPISIAWAYRVAHLRGPTVARAAGLLVALAGLAVLVWSGSKAGWLIALAVGVIAFLTSPAPARLRALGAALVLILGLAAFGGMYAQKLKAGATSVSARFDYWTAAVQGVRESPWVGHGPGGFKRVYSRVKRPESEMAQLTHNDYLQQAVDSGLPGALAYLGFMGLAATTLVRRRRQLWQDPLLGAASAGVLAWFLQGTVEFGLYIPATAWCAFVLLGWILAQKPSPALPSSLTSN